MYSVLPGTHSSDAYVHIFHIFRAKNKNGALFQLVVLGVSPRSPAAKTTPSPGHCCAFPRHRRERLSHVGAHAVRCRDTSHTAACISTLCSSSIVEPQPCAANCSIVSLKLQVDEKVSKHKQAHLPRVFRVNWCSSSRLEPPWWPLTGLKVFLDDTPKLNRENMVALCSVYALSLKALLSVLWSKNPT